MGLHLGRGPPGRPPARRPHREGDDGAGRAARQRRLPHPRRTRVERGEVHGRSPVDNRPGRKARGATRRDDAGRGGPRAPRNRPRRLETPAGGRASPSPCGGKPSRGHPLESRWRSEHHARFGAPRTRDRPGCGRARGRDRMCRAEGRGLAGRAPRGRRGVAPRLRDIAGARGLPRATGCRGPALRGRNGGRTGSCASRGRTRRPRERRGPFPRRRRSGGSRGGPPHSAERLRAKDAGRARCRAARGPLLVPCVASRPRGAGGRRVQVRSRDCARRERLRHLPRARRARPR